MAVLTVPLSSWVNVCSMQGFDVLYFRDYYDICSASLSPPTLQFVSNFIYILLTMGCAKVYSLCANCNQYQLGECLLIWSRSATNTDSNAFRWPVTWGITFRLALTSKMHRLTSNSIGLISDLYPYVKPNNISLGYSRLEKCGRQTDRHTDIQTYRHTHRRNPFLYSCPLRLGQL